jgi:hypothetical protein
VKVHGTTDELGFSAIENKVSMQDWHATALQLLGLHDDELHFDRNRLEEKLTATFETRVVQEILS